MRFSVVMVNSIITRTLDVFPLPLSFVKYGAQKETV